MIVTVKNVIDYIELTIQLLSYILPRLGN